ncbi:MAG TPA: glycosyltransferase [Pyrinomonadaceae bacterium]|jgi:glycosyltransferase involved in cell wall biosynthesis
MRVAYLSSAGQLGGAENALLDVISSLRDALPDAHEPRLIAPAEGTLAARARALGIPVTVLPLPRALARLGDAGAGGPAGRRVSRAALAARLAAAGAAGARYVRRLRGALGALAPDVVHANGLKMQLLGGWARPPGAALVWHVHDYAGGRPFAARLLRLAASRCALSVANSESVAGDLRSVTAGRVRVCRVYNAVDLGRFAPAGAALDLDEAAGLAPAEAGAVRVGLVATLARWKGHETFFEALSLLPRELRVRGYVVGGALYETDGSQHTTGELRRLAARHGVADRVAFTGFVADAPAAMRALDVVVHCSTAPEPFGLVIAEAMACGRAVVAARAGGAAEIFTPGLDALGHEPGDARGLASAVGRLAADAGLRAALGRAARRTAERRFDRARLAGEWAAVYREASRREEKGDCLEAAGGLRGQSAPGV